MDCCTLICNLNSPSSLNIRGLKFMKTINKDDFRLMDLTNGGLQSLKTSANRIRTPCYILFASERAGLIRCSKGKQMPKSLPEQFTIEKSPSYFITPGVPQRIKNMSSSVKLLLAVRDPVQRAISDHAQSLSKGKIRTLEERVMKETNKKEVDPESYIVKIGMYARHYRQWLAHFPKSQILLVSGEELVTDPAKVMADVQKFLNLEEVVNGDYFFFNETKGFPCLKRDPNETVPKCLDGSKGRPHPNVDPVVVERLRRYYKPFNEEFYKMAGIDFHWS